jgi:hypothetical protein
MSAVRAGTLPKRVSEGRLPYNPIVAFFSK